MLAWLKKFLNVEKTSKKEKLISAFIFFIYIFLVGFRGNKIGEEGVLFYNSLIKPASTPAVWAFPFIWTIIFVLIGLAGYHVWNFYESDRLRKAFAGLYFINGIFVYLWPYFFFTKQSITTALYVIIGLIIIVELMILVAFKTNRKAAYLLLPYLIWIFFVTYLNTGFIILNV